MIDWDAYRRAYPLMTYAQVADFHRRVWASFPDQENCSRDLLARFFESVPSGSQVVELGGWRGEMADHILSRRADLRGWLNMEICEDAVALPVTADPRYVAVHPKTWPWERPLRDRYEVAVLAHVIEHMLSPQLARLVPWLSAGGVRRIYVEAPLRDKPRSWRHSTSGHILDIGWDGVVSLFGKHGYCLQQRHHYPPDRGVLFFG